VLGVLSTLALMGLASPVLGADVDQAVAKAHYEAGTRLYDIKEWTKALEEFKTAYLSKPDPAFLYNIGQCYRKLGQASQALEFYKEYLKKTSPADPNRANVEARVHEMERGTVSEDEAPAKPTVPPLPATRSGVGTGAQPVTKAGTVPATGGQDLAPAAFGTTPPAGFPAEGPRPGLDLTAASDVGKGRSGVPIYKTWWFWTGVGAVVVACTVTAIIVAGSGGKSNSVHAALGTQGVFQ